MTLTTLSGSGRVLVGPSTGRDGYRQNQYRHYQQESETHETSPSREKRAGSCIDRSLVLGCPVWASLVNDASLAETILKQCSLRKRTRERRST